MMRAPSHIYFSPLAISDSSCFRKHFQCNTSSLKLKTLRELEKTLCTGSMLFWRHEFLLLSLTNVKTSSHVSEHLQRLLFHVNRFRKDRLASTASFTSRVRWTVDAPRQTKHPQRHRGSGQSAPHLFGCYYAPYIRKGCYR